MKAEEIKTFLDANSDLFQHFYTNVSQSELELAVGIDDVPKLLQRLFESKEYKSFVAEKFMPNIDRVWTFER